MCSDIRRVYGLFRGTCHHFCNHAVVIDNTGPSYLDHSTPGRLVSLLSLEAGPTPLNGNEAGPKQYSYESGAEIQETNTLPGLSGFVNLVNLSFR